MNNLNEFKNVEADRIERLEEKMDALKEQLDRIHEALIIMLESPIATGEHGHDQ